MNTRVATNGDIPVIAGLARSLQWTCSTGGFLVYVLKEDEYGARLNPFFTVAEVCGEVVGFLMCYSEAFLCELKQDNRIGHEDGIVSFLEQQPSPFLFGDQIGVNKKHQHSGIGRQLLQDMCNRIIPAGNFNWYVSVLHHPIKNQESIDFVTNFGFHRSGEVQNRDGFIWGMYHLDLSRAKKVDEFENKSLF